MEHVSAKHNLFHNHESFYTCDCHIKINICETHKLKAERAIKNNNLEECRKILKEYLGL